MPDFLQPVTADPLAEGSDLGAHHGQRSAELATANSRITRARNYLQTNCAPRAK